jgi:quercetin dioxygenase-like cupin family protein
MKDINEKSAGRETYSGYGIEWLVSRQVNNAAELTLGRTTIAVGARNPLHRHPNCEEGLYVLSGKVEHLIEGTPSVILESGQAILVPRDLKHRAINIGSEPAVLLVVFSSADRETVIVEE